MSCPVCLDNVTRPVACPHCAVEFCTPCFERCLLNDDLVPTCANCDRPWTDDFTDEAVNSTIRNGSLRAHRTKILVDQETARLPELQERARRYLLAKKNNRPRAPHYISMIVIRNGQQLNTLWYTAPEILAGDQFYGNSDWRSDGVAGERGPLKVMRTCPKACRGFLGENGICGMCEAAICLKCHEEIQNEEAPPHHCDAAAVATVALLIKETKPCPTCHVPISKIDGCDQMWCTQCQTAFSWRTGQKEAGVVHNPHYYQWMRTNGNAIPRNDVPADPCALQQLPWTEVVFPRSSAPLLDNINPLRGHRFLRLVEGMHRSVAEANAYNIAPNQQRHMDNLNNISFKYLIKAIPAKEWARLIYLEKRAQRRMGSFHGITAAYYSAGKDLVNAFIANTLVPADFVRQMHALQKFIDEAMLRCRQRFFYASKHRNVTPASWNRIVGDELYIHAQRPAELEALSAICGREIKDESDMFEDDYETYINYVIAAGGHAAPHNPPCPSVSE
jgi:hypothetical protein